MKVTRELKDVIARKLQEMEQKERQRINEERWGIVDELNKNLIESDEFKSLIAAAEKWEKLVADVVEANEEAASRSDADARYGGQICAWNMKNMLKATKIEPLLVHYEHNLRLEYLDKQDAIIMRLSYGKDFEEAKTILAEYGITI